MRNGLGAADVRPAARLSLVSFYPEMDNVLVTKDIGMIPWVMGRDHGIDAVALSYRNGDYPFAARLPDLRMEFSPVRLPRVRRAVMAINRLSPWMGQKLKPLFVAPDAIAELRRRRPDALLLFHLTLESMVVGFLYRLLRRDGVLCLKLDMSSERELPPPAGRARRRSRPLAAWGLRLAGFDIVTVETEALRAHLAGEDRGFRRLAERLILVRNGVDARELGPLPPPNGREDVVLHVAQLGHAAKGTDVALAAFAAAASRHSGWRLRLVGPARGRFEEDLAAFRTSHPDVASRIEWTGEIRDRGRLLGEYARARVLLAPSRTEGFSFSALEGAAMGLALVASDLISFRELTDGGRLARLVRPDDAAGFAHALAALMADPGAATKEGGALAASVREQFAWSQSCGTLAEAVREAARRRGGGPSSE